MIGDTAATHAATDDDHLRMRRKIWHLDSLLDLSGRRPVRSLRARLAPWAQAGSAPGLRLGQHGVRGKKKPPMQAVSTIRYVFRREWPLRKQHSFLPCPTPSSMILRLPHRAGSWPLCHYVEGGHDAQREGIRVG